MMNPKTFRIQKLRRYFTLAIAIASGGALSWLSYSMFPFLFNESNRLTRLIFLPLFALPLLALIFLGYLVWAMWSYRIEFWENELRVSRYGNPFVRQIQCSYINMAYIRRPTMKGVVEIVPVKGKSFQLLGIVEGGGDGLVDELERHITPEKFQPYLRSELKKFSRYDKVTFALPISLLLLYVLLYGSKVIVHNTAWETMWSPNVLGFGNINGFWIDNDSVWVSYSKAFTNSSEIVRISGENKVSWNIGQGNFYPEAVLTDSNNLPWVIGFDSFYHWTGSSWQRYQFENFTISSLTPIVIDGVSWASAYQKNTKLSHLIKLDLDSGAITPVYLPDELAKDQFSIRAIKKSLDGSLYVMVAKPYSPVYFYTLNNGQWKKEATLDDVEWKAPSQLFRNSEPYLGVKDFVLDKSGEVWAIMEKENHYLIGRYNSPTNSWEWSQIENDCNLCTRSYDGIVVDTQGRAWLKGEFGHKNKVTDTFGILDGWNVDVFLPNWNGTAEQLKSYTDKNSNYQLGFFGNSLRLSEDGYIWSAHDRVVRINANRQELPEPLPNWFVKLTSPQTTLAGVIVLGGLYLIYVIIYSIFFKSKGLSKPPA